jgi:hypothetical protein
VRDVQDEVEALAAHLGCAVLIEDPRHRPLWWSTQRDIDGTRLRTILQREVPPAAAALVSRLGLASAEQPVRTPTVPEADMAERWCVPVREGRQLYGYLWVLDADGRVGEMDLPAAIECAYLAARTLARARPSDDERERRRTALLSRLQDAPDLEAAQGLIDLDDLPASVTVAVSTAVGGGGIALRGGLRVHLDPPAGTILTSGHPVPLLDLHIAMRRAAVTRQALDAGARLAAPTWDALGSWHLVVAAPAELTPAMIHPGAAALLDPRRADLLRTAHCVLDNGGDVTRSAEQLHIHRTTLYYRLTRVEALTGVNLRLADGRDDLHLALQLAAYRAAG